MKNIQIPILCLGLFLTSCAMPEKKPARIAPVVDGWQQRQEASLYRVQPEDTIYSIAWAFGMDYQQIAKNNHLSEPYHLRPGQTLSLSGQSSGSNYASHSSPSATDTPGVVTYAVPEAGTYSYVPAQNGSSATTNTASNGFRSVPPKGATASTTDKTSGTLQTTETSSGAGSIATAATPPTPPSAGKGSWAWPTKGKLVKGYSGSSGGNRGIDISGRLDQPVVASASGKVVYAGSNMPGYGKLIIIKHNNNDLSAYAFNNTILVKEGEAVKAGQGIATMGKDTKGEPMLHFEVRKNGKPQDPMNYLGGAS